MGGLGRSGGANIYGSDKDGLGGLDARLFQYVNIEKLDFSILYFFFFFLHSKLCVLTKFEAVKLATHKMNGGHVRWCVFSHKIRIPSLSSFCFRCSNNNNKPAGELLPVVGFREPEACSCERVLDIDCVNVGLGVAFRSSLMMVLRISVALLVTRSVHTGISA